jgi:hypothetical protein
MKLPLSAIVNSSEAFGRLISEKMPISISYLIVRNFKILEEEFKRFELAKNKLIMEKYGNETEEPGKWIVPSENEAGFREELNELLSLEVDLDIIPVKLVNEINISPADLYLLEWMFVIPDEK